MMFIYITTANDWGNGNGGIRAAIKKMLWGI
jgi:hypothetical protein